MTREEEVLLAARAKNLLNDPLLNQVLAALEVDIFNEWKHCDTPAGRDALHAELKALDRFKAKLKTIIDAGALAEAPKPPQPV